MAHLASTSLSSTPNTSQSQLHTLLSALPNVENGYLTEVQLRAPGQLKLNGTADVPICLRFQLADDELECYCTECLEQCLEDEEAEADEQQTLNEANNDGAAEADVEEQEERPVERKTADPPVVYLQYIKENVLLCLNDFALRVEDTVEIGMDSETSPKPPTSDNKEEDSHQTVLPSPKADTASDKVSSLPQRFKCSHCSSSFSRRSNLYKHLYRATGFKPYTCDFCNDSFIKSSQLRAHMQSHREKNRFGCEKCGLRFATRFNLNRHQRSEFRCRGESQREEQIPNGV